MSSKTIHLLFWVAVAYIVYTHFVRKVPIRG